MTLLPVVMDGALAGAILAAIVLQSTYLPRPLGQCGNALDWHPKNAPSMFLVLTLPDPADWPSTPVRETAKGMCNEFVTAWFFEIVIAYGKTPVHRGKQTRLADKFRGLLCIALLFDIRYACDECLGGNGEDRNPWAPRRRLRRNFFWDLLAPHMRYRTRYADKKTEHQQSLPVQLAGSSGGGSPSLSQKLSGYLRSLAGLSQSGADTEPGTSGLYHSPRSDLLPIPTPNYGTMIHVRFGQSNTQECAHIGGGVARDCWSCGTGICDVSLVKKFMSQVGSLTFCNSHAKLTLGTESRAPRSISTTVNASAPTATMRDTARTSSASHSGILATASADTRRGGLLEKKHMRSARVAGGVESICVW